jgi:hypothetical protein
MASGERMKIETVNALSLSKHGRLDSKYFLSAGLRAAERISLAKSRGLHCVPLGGNDGLAKIWQPIRFKRAYASPNEISVPYLRPYDVFEYLPMAADILSVSRNKKIDSYRLRRGMILQSCSGRNLGSAIFVDNYLANFVVGDDMIRIEIDNDYLRNYVLAYLKSPTGQQLLKQGMTGSVIDHISKDHIGKLDIPLFEPKLQKTIADLIERSVTLREEARIKLDAALSAYEQLLPKPLRSKPMKNGWTVKAKELTERLDAASYDPLVSNIRKKLTALGGVPVSSVATVIKPAGRYKTYYVDSEHGRPILSGTQLLQANPINLRFIASRAFKDASLYELRKGWLAYQADGRAEETLGLPVMITSDRDGWLASGHVGRIIANDNIDAGWLYLAARTWCAQIQLKALASGSVVDSTFPWDMESVVLPPPMNVDGKVVQNMWERFAEAQQAENEAIAIMEKFLNQLN